MATLVTAKALIDNAYAGPPDYGSAGVPFGRASTAVLGDGTFLVGQPIQDDEYATTWTMRIWHLDANLNILGEVSQTMGALCRAAMIPTSGQKAIVVMHQPNQVNYARWNVEATGGAPVISNVLSFTGPTDRWSDPGVGNYGNPLVTAYVPETDIALFANARWLTYFVGDQIPGESIPISTYDGMGNPVSIWAKPGAPGTFGIVDDLTGWWEATVSPDGWGYTVLDGSNPNANQQNAWWQPGGSPYDDGPILNELSIGTTNDSGITTYNEYDMQLVDPSTGSVLVSVPDTAHYLSSTMAFAPLGDKHFLTLGHFGPMGGGGHSATDFVHRVYDVDYSTSPPTCVATDLLTPFSPQPDTLQVGSESVAARVGKIVAASCTVDNATDDYYSLVVWSLTYPFQDVVVPVDEGLSNPGLNVSPAAPRVKFSG